MISIIVPVYNKQKTLNNCIKSILHQKYKDFEIIIVDDGSTDDGKRIIFSFNDSRIKYYYQSNAGVSSARNLGIKVASGEYISFLDADDEWHSDFLFEMVSNIGDSDLCYCGHYFKKKNSDLIKARFKYTTSHFLEYYLKNSCTPNTNSWLIKRVMLTSNNIYFLERITWGEDMLFFINCILHSRKVSYVKESLTYYNLEVENHLSNNAISKIEDDIFWMNKAIDMIIENKNSYRKYVNIITKYRIPAAILYRIYNSLDTCELSTLEIYLKRYKKDIRRVNLCNGLRSLKLFMIYIELYIQFNLKKID